MTIRVLFILVFTHGPTIVGPYQRKEYTGFETCTKFVGSGRINCMAGYLSFKTIRIFNVNGKWVASGN